MPQVRPSVMVMSAVRRIPGLVVEESLVPVGGDLGSIYHLRPNEDTLGAFCNEAA